MITADDELNLPEGWCVAKLADGLITGIQSGFACGSNNRAGEGVPHLRPMNVNVDGEIDLTDVKYVPTSELNRDERWLRSGDVVFNNTNSPALVGKTACYADETPRAFSNHMTRLRCRADAFDPRFCAFVLHHKWQTGYFESICNNHVSQSSIGRGVLLDTLIELPPLAEQRRIVAKVDALLSRVQAVRERLAHIPAILKRFRQSVLAAACDGRLSADWRERTGRRTPESRLLACLLSLREQRWSDFVKTRYKPPADFDRDNELQIPDGWICASMDQLTVLITSGSRDWSKYYGRGTGTFIMAQNVRPGRLDLSARQPVDPPLDDRDRARSQVIKGDLLVTIVGANTGDVCALTEELPEHYVCQSVSLMRPSDPMLAPYLNLYLNSTAHGRGQYDRYIYGEGRPHLSFDQLRMTPVLLPPMAEQHEICRRVDGLFKMADTIERHVTGSAARADKLTQAILAKALRGELVPTEAEVARAEGRDYEPASVLLGRIRTIRIGPSQRQRATAAAVDPLFPSTARDQTLCSGILDLVAAEPGLPEAAYVEAIRLLMNDALVSKLLHGNELRAWKAMSRKGTRAVDRSTETFNWFTFRDYLVNTGALVVEAQTDRVKTGPRLQAVRRTLPAHDSTVIALVIKAAKVVRNYQSLVGTERRQVEAIQKELNAEAAMQR